MLLRSCSRNKSTRSYGLQHKSNKRLSSKDWRSSSKAWYWNAGPWRWSSSTAKATVWRFGWPSKRRATTFRRRLRRLRAIKKRKRPRTSTRPKRLSHIMKPFCSKSVILLRSSRCKESTAKSPCGSRWQAETQRQRHRSIPPSCSSSKPSNESAKFWRGRRRSGINPTQCCGSHCPCPRNPRTKPSSAFAPQFSIWRLICRVLCEMKRGRGN
mmetsp:Transcript_42155/g.68223  ORF Transcript_42155/g.68223 Transcript_42155/m.68223 type:complete len:212 (+) Transcript_42155:351-986(+)